jgi:hypothetical protein
MVQEYDAALPEDSADSAAGLLFNRAYRAGLRRIGLGATVAGARKQAAVRRLTIS